MEFQMRNKTFISSMVGVAAAVAVAGSANAGVVDPFTTTQAFGTDSLTGFVSISGGLFNQRNAVRTTFAGGTGVSQPNNNVAFTTRKAGFGVVSLSYQNSGGSSNDLSLITEMSIALSALNLSNGATGVSFSWLVTDVNTKQMYANQDLFSNGTSTFDFAAATKDLGFDLTKVTNMEVFVSQIGGTTTETAVSGTLSNFSYTAVPAPGALALLGAAGLVGARRRRA
jgi:hypothetical protein